MSHELPLTTTDHVTEEYSKHLDFYAWIVAWIASSDSEDERDIVEYYFARGFQYNAIVDFLSKRHGISMSERTLRSRLNAYCLRRRSPKYNLDEIRGLIQEKLRGPACMGGYRSMWHALLISGHQVPRNVVEQLMRELDPEGCQIRKARCLHRRLLYFVVKILARKYCNTPNRV
jgi:hypothetical protein